MFLATGQEFARASILDSIFRSFVLANMTGLRKKDGGVRGIHKDGGPLFGGQNTGEAVYERSLARLAGVDCVGHGSGWRLTRSSCSLSSIIFTSSPAPQS